MNFRTKSSSEGFFFSKHYELIRLADFSGLRHFSTKASLLSSLITLHTETELTRQMTPPTENGHAPRSIESKKSNLSIRTVSERLPRKLGQHWLPSQWSFDPTHGASDGTGEEREDTWKEHSHGQNGLTRKQQQMITLSEPTSVDIFLVGKNTVHRRD